MFPVPTDEHILWANLSEPHSPPLHLEDASEMDSAHLMDFWERGMENRP